MLKVIVYNPGTCELGPDSRRAAGGRTASHLYIIHKTYSNNEYVVIVNSDSNHVNQ